MIKYGNKVEAQHGRSKYIASVADIDSNLIDEPTYLRFDSWINSAIIRLNTTWEYIIL